MTEMMRPSCPAIYLPSFAPCGPAPKMAARWLNSPCRFSRLDRAVTAVRVNTTAASPKINHSPAHSRENSSEILRTKPIVAISSVAVSPDLMVPRTASYSQTCAAATYAPVCAAIRTYVPPPTREPRDVTSQDHYQTPSPPNNTAHKH